MAEQLGYIGREFLALTVRDALAQASQSRRKRYVVGHDLFWRVVAELPDRRTAHYRVWPGGRVEFRPALAVAADDLGGRVSGHGEARRDERRASPRRGGWDGMC